MTNARFDGGNAAVEELREELGDFLDEEEESCARTEGGNKAVKMLKEELRNLLSDVRQDKTAYQADVAGQRPKLMEHVGRILVKLVRPFQTCSM